MRKRAALRIAYERPGQTLDATASVHEAYLRLVKVPVRPCRLSMPGLIGLIATGRLPKPSHGGFKHGLVLCMRFLTILIVFPKSHQTTDKCRRGKPRKVIRFSARSYACRNLIRFGGMRPRAA
ncbi:MAG TPA: hypothetical protein VGP76_16810 [Planctomycetaceae bacterium]|nr:hypothetical protein [Planctomycetaceae bacterium]